MEIKTNEKVLVQGTNYKVHLILVIGIVLAIILLAYSLIWNSNQYDPDPDSFLSDADMSFFEHGFEYGYFGPFIYGGLPILVVAGVFYFAVTGNNIIVTDKRVIGKTFFGKKVDLPIDKISAVSSFSLLKGVGVATSSGVIRFAFVKNATEVNEALSSLLIERQSPNADEKQSSSVDDLRKWKNLLDEGVITQEEFETKKKQYLDS